MVDSAVQQSNSTNYINQYILLMNEVTRIYESSMPNYNKAEELLQKANRFIPWIKNDNTLCFEDKYAILGDELYD